jgi:hypothetical protein
MRHTCHYHALFLGAPRLGDMQVYVLSDVIWSGYAKISSTLSSLPVEVKAHTCAAIIVKGII